MRIDKRKRREEWKRPERGTEEKVKATRKKRQREKTRSRAVAGKGERRVKRLVVNKIRVPEGPN